MFTFLLIVQTLVAASLVGVILMQRSEGGGLGVGGSSSGFMTARGAADFLTRATAILGGAVHHPVDRAGGDRRRDARAGQDRHLAGQRRAAPARSSRAPATPAPAAGDADQPARAEPAAPAVPLAQ